MPSLKEVKNRISSVESTQQITKAMKMVAAAKLRKAQDMIVKLRPYADKLNKLQEHIVAGLNEDDTNTSPYVLIRDVHKVLVVVIGSDRGLCGAFNTSTFKKAVQLIENDYRLMLPDNVEVLPVGKKAMEFFKRRSYPVNNSFHDIGHEFSFEKVAEMADYLMDGFIKHKYDRVVLVYNEFKNAATQILKEENYLPLISGLFTSAEDSGVSDYIFEPDKEELLSEIIPTSLRIQLYKAFLDSNASEQGARMVAMEKATENAGELLRQLRLTYNRTRQATITREILEIVAGAEALSSGD